MRTNKKRRQQRNKTQARPKTVKRLRELVDDDGAGFDLFPSDESIARAAQVAASMHKLHQWEVGKKLPHRIATVNDAMKFVEEAKKGRIDTAQLSSLTAVLRGLEAEARELDEKQKAANPFPLTKWDTPFDIENATLGNQAAKAIDDVVNDVLKEGNELVNRVPSAVPTWVYVGGGLAVGLFALAQIAQISNAAAMTAQLRGPNL